MKGNHYFVISLSITLAIIVTTSCETKKAHQEDNLSHKPKATEGTDNETNMQGMEERGNKVMGFEQMKTTHHFYLLSSGGTIEVEANDSSDTTSQNQIRQHLIHITTMFANGNFDAPMLIHAQTPPGVPTMQRLKADITYQYENTEKGGRIHISTSNAEALDAIHEFLRFQIKEHRTGDSVEVQH
ncbi:MAG TPA: hypothetical protein VH878_09765 [Thermodesulfobacteriota bacterium]